MNKIQLILIALVVTSCNSTESPIEKAEVNPTSSPEKTIGTMLEKNTKKEISNVLYNSEIGLEIPTAIQQTGTLVDAVSWEDALGTNYLHIYTHQKGEFFAQGFESELHAYHHFSDQEGSWKEQWHVKDFGGEIYRTVDYWPHSLKVVDLDNDGRAETEFIYTITPDGLDPFDVKYMLHSEGKKLPIRGQYVYQEDQLMELDKSIDQALQEKGEPFLTHAEQKWQAWAEEHPQKEL